MKRLLKRLFCGELETWPGLLLGLLWLVTIGWMYPVIAATGGLVAKFDGMIDNMAAKRRAK